MKLLIPLCLLLSLLSCNQQTILYGSGNIQSKEVLLTDSVNALSITLDARPVEIIRDTINKVVITCDDNLLTGYSVTYDSIHAAVEIKKSADQQLLANSFHCTLHLKTSPQQISVSNCSLSIDKGLTKTTYLSVRDKGYITNTNKSDSLQVEIRDMSEINLSGKNQTQHIILHEGAQYRYTQLPLYTAWVELAPHSKCTVAVEKYIYGTLADYSNLTIQGNPLVKTKNNLHAVVDYIK